MGQKLIRSEKTYPPAVALAKNHGRRFIGEVLGLWEQTYGRKKASDNRKMIVELFTHRKSPKESMQEFCTGKSRLADKLRTTLLRYETSYKPGLESAILGLLPSPFEAVSYTHLTLPTKA